MSNSNIRLKQHNGKIDDQGVLTISPSNLASTGENLTNGLLIELPDEILSSYRLYFDFVLPTKERFISEPITPEFMEFDSVDELTRQPITYTALVAKYVVPAYVCRVAGPCLVSLKATNDSVTVYKSKTCTMTIDQGTDSEYDDRYYRGDLLDYLVVQKLDTLEYYNGWVHVYATNPTLAKEYELINDRTEITDGTNNYAVVDNKFTIDDVEYEIVIVDGSGVNDYVYDGENQYPIHYNKFTLHRLLVTKFPMMMPVFQSLESAQDWTKNSGEASIGQFISVTIFDGTDDEDNITGWKSEGFIVNPDFTLNPISSSGTGSYENIDDKPTLSTDNQPGTLDPVTEKIGRWEDGKWNGNIDLTRIAKTGKLSDAINDRLLVTSATYSFNESGSYSIPFTKYDQDTPTHFVLKSIKVNKSFDGEFKLIYNNEVLVSSEDVDLSVVGEIEFNYEYQLVDELVEALVEINSTGVIDIDMTITYN